MNQTLIAGGALEYLRNNLDYKIRKSNFTSSQTKAKQIRKISKRSRLHNRQKGLHI